MNQYGQVDLDFDECHDFFDSLQSDGYTSQSSVSPFAFTPSPQDILNTSFGENNPYSASGDEWALEQMLSLEGQKQPQEQQQAQPSDASAANGRNREYNVTEPFSQPSYNYTVKRENVSNNSSPSNWFNSRPSSISSYNSDIEQNLTSDSGLTSAAQTTNPVYPFTPPLSGVSSGTNASDNENPDYSNSSYPPSINTVVKQESVSSPKSNNTISGLRTSVTGSSRKSGKVAKPKRVKCSHNVIEKRYRSNINDKILALRDCVPALRVKVSGDVDDSELDGLAPAMKLNKATVLTKATEYILHLQKRNALLARELEELKSSMARDLSRPTSSSSTSSSTRVSFQAYPYSPSNSSTRSVVPKAMMCTMAGMMGAGMYSEGESGQRGLSALPMPFASLLMTNRGLSLVRSLKIFLVFGSLVYVFLPLFLPKSSKGPSKGFKSYTVSSGSLEALRKETWLTCSQMWNFPPPHNMLLTVQATLFAMFQVLVSLVIGLHKFNIFARRPIDDSLTPFKAVDSQLSGGDIFATKLRVLLTFLQSLLCKPTPRLHMVHAVQIEVLLHDYVSSEISNLVSKYFWSKARMSAKEVCVGEALDEIPSHLLALLECDDVFLPETVQRVYNCCFGFSASHNCLIGVGDVGFETVAKDERLNSVLSLVGSWHGCRLLHEVLVQYVDDGTVDAKKLDVCKSIAPQGSRVQIRVAVIRALLLESKDAAPIKEAMDIMRNELQGVQRNGQEESTNEGLKEEDPSESSSGSSISDGDVGYSPNGISTEGERVPEDCRLAIHCSILNYYLANAPKLAPGIITKMPLVELDLLGFVAVLKTFVALRKANQGIGESKLESLSASARIWIGSEEAEIQGLSLARRRQLVGECIKFGTFFGGIELDEGYGSE